MTYDPIDEVEDEQLSVDDAVVAELVAFRGKPKLENLPGEDTTVERERLSSILNALADTLILKVSPRISASTDLSPSSWPKGRFSSLCKVRSAKSAESALFPKRWRSRFLSPGRCLNWAGIE